MAALRGRGAIAAALLAAALAAAAAIAFVSGRDAGEPLPTAPAAGNRPSLLLLTSLPLVFGEDFGLDGGSRALSALERGYRVLPIGVADSASLGDSRLLLMVQPLAQPAEALVDLDRWVRAGGRVMLLADPMLEWESSRPLGDRFRPPFAFADTGLLRRWGLRLDAPDEAGPRQLPLGGHRVLTASPGVLSGRCDIGPAGLVARCALGKGFATVVADADFLNVDDLDGPTGRNLDALVAELGELQRR